MCYFIKFNFICLTFFSINAFAADIEGKDAYAFYLENDSRNIGGPGSDQAYSSGVKFSYIYAQGQIPKWSTPAIDYLHILDNNAKWAKVNFGLSLGHQIFTPNDTQTTELVASDRPYAAWLYLGFAVSLKERNVEHFLEIDLGTIGPSALGEPIQNGFHSLIGSGKTNGWRNGLKDEPTLQVFYQKRHKQVFSQNLDFVPYYGVGLGNVLIGGHAGGIIRLGSYLPDDFGASRPSASDGNSFISASSYSTESKLSYYFFGGARGNYIARNIFLDGNTFHESHEVKKHLFTFETEVGFGLHFYSGTLVWRFVTKSPEFDERKEFNSFASLSFVYAR